MTRREQQSTERWLSIPRRGRLLNGFRGCKGSLTYDRSGGSDLWWDQTGEGASGSGGEHGDGGV